MNTFPTATINDFKFEQGTLLNTSPWGDLGNMNEPYRWIGIAQYGGEFLFKEVSADEEDLSIFTHYRVYSTYEEAYAQFRKMILSLDHYHNEVFKYQNDVPKPRVTCEAGTELGVILNGWEN